MEIRKDKQNALKAMESDKVATKNGLYEAADRALYRVKENGRAACGMAENA